MKRMKVSELEGAQLDQWVARAEGKCFTTNPGKWGNALINDLGRLSIAKNSWDCARYFEPSSNWTHGGPIIEREGISPMRWEIPSDDGTVWSARNLHATVHMSGPTPLIAAMRVYVASKFGDEIPA